MFIGGICYCIFIGALIYPFVWSLFLGSVIIGFGAAMIWTGQGNFITINSNEETMGRNSGIFWALLQCSLLFGNMFVYFYFKGTADHVSDNERVTLYSVLLTCCLLGTVLLIALRRTQQPVARSSGSSPMNDEGSDGNCATCTQGPVDAFKRSFQLLITPDMLMLAVTMAYTGFELTFFSGVYGTSIGNILKLEDRHRQVGLIGMCIGVGEITGGLLFGILGKRTNRYGRDPIVLMGFIVHMITFYLIFMNVPNQAPLQETDGYSWFHYNLPGYAMCAVLLGFGDACFNTQLYSILGVVYSEDSAPAFALFKFIQSVTAAIGFGYATHLVLNYQLLILVVMAFAGTITFIKVERSHSQRSVGYEPIR